MIGDRPNTDIMFGKAAGIDQCLVLSGVVHNMQDFEENWLTEDIDYDPTWVMQMVGDRTAKPYVESDGVEVPDSARSDCTEASLFQKLEMICQQDVSKYAKAIRELKLLEIKAKSYVGNDLRVFNMELKR